MNDLAQLLVNSSGAALVSGLFIWYLIKRDKVLDKYLENSVETNEKLATNLERFSNVIKEQKEMIVKLYEQNYLKAKKLKSYENHE